MVLLIAGAAALGCGPEDPEIPPITWAGEHLEYAPQGGAPEPCAGTLEYMDRYVARIADAMGVELRGPVLFVHGSEDDPSPCTEGDYGCAFEGGVYSRGVPQEHELVHGVRRQYGGSMRFCTQSQYRYPMVACEQPVDLRAQCDETVELWPVRVDCEDPSTLGPRTEGMFRYLMMEVETDGHYELEAVDPADPFPSQSLELKECVLGCDSILHQQLHWSEASGSPVWLRTGRYTIKLPMQQDYPTDVMVRVEGLGCG